MRLEAAFQAKSKRVLIFCLLPAVLRQNLLANSRQTAPQTIPSSAGGFCPQQARFFQDSISMNALMRVRSCPVGSPI